MRPACDVFVAGAGPAGALAALRLAQRGISVVLADRSAFPRTKVCGSCLGGLALAALDAAGLGDLPDRFDAPVLTSAEFFARGRSARIAIPAGRALSRLALDHALVRAATDAGAEFRPGRAARLVFADADGVRIRLGQDEEITARIAIAADGLAGSFLEGRPDLSVAISSSARMGAGVIVSSDAPVGPGVVHMSVARDGYVGLVRLEDGRLDVAACLDRSAVRRSGGPGPLVAEILEQAGRPPVPEIAGAAFRGTAPLTRRRADVAAERIFVVGDSAGYVEPFTGEGMGWAMAGAGAVAALVEESVRRWRPRTAESWRRRHAAVVRRRQSVCRAVAAMLRRPGLAGAMIRLLGNAPALARPILAHMNARHREIAA